MKAGVSVERLRVEKANKRLVLARKMVHSFHRMSKSLEGNGKGNGDRSNGLLQRPRKQATQPSPEPSAVESEKNKVAVQMHNGVTLHGAPVHIERHHIAFEVFNPAAIPQLSEALDKFIIVLQGRTVYSGRAVISHVVDAGAKMVCEATLDEMHWTDLNQILASQKDGQVMREFKSFLKDWQKFYKVLPEFKIVIADMQTLFTDLRLWLERVELGIQSLPVKERKEFQQKVTKEAGELFVPAFDELHEKLEAISGKIDEDLRPAHRIFAQRQLHPLILCSPFAHRACEKPLGYAGDYEIVNMIALNPYQGETLFAKIVNLWFLSQWPSKAHRNRLSYLKERLEKETCRASAGGRKARIFNFACGPAIEVQRYLADFQFPERAELTLADFNQETLNYAAKAVGTIKERLSLETVIRFQKKSVYQILKENQTRLGEKQEYDFVYCAGLFDYLPDITCRQLMEIFYGWLAPDGLLVVTNVVDNKPFRHMLEFVLDWYLIYRDAEQSTAIIPEPIPDDARAIKMDPTGVNLFIEVRKPRE